MVLQDVVMKGLFQQLLACSKLKPFTVTDCSPSSQEQTEGCSVSHLWAFAGAVLLPEGTRFSPKLRQVIHALSSSHSSEQHFSNFSPKHPQQQRQITIEEGWG